MRNLGGLASNNVKEGWKGPTNEGAVGDEFRCVQGQLVYARSHLWEHEWQGCEEDPRFERPLVDASGSPRPPAHCELGVASPRCIMSLIICAGGFWLGEWAWDKWPNDPCMCVVRPPARGLPLESQPTPARCLAHLSETPVLRDGRQMGDIVPREGTKAGRGPMAHQPWPWLQPPASRPTTVVGMW